MLGVYGCGIGLRLIMLLGLGFHDNKGHFFFNSQYGPAN